LNRSPINTGDCKIAVKIPHSLVFHLWFVFFWLLVCDFLMDSRVIFVNLIRKFIPRRQMTFKSQFTWPKDSGNLHYVSTILVLRNGICTWCAKTNSVHLNTIHNKTKLALSQQPHIKDYGPVWIGLGIGIVLTSVSVAHFRSTELGSCNLNCYRHRWKNVWMNPQIRDVYSTTIVTSYSNDTTSRPTSH
jgi:hypothetical protein